MGKLGRKLGGKTKNWVKEDHQLGMSIGTASNRLRKQLMFEAVKSLGQNFCYRCGVEIETAEELTVDHKQEWRGVDSALFWDLSNCAWSHHSCNSGASRQPRKMIPAEPGMAWCWCCKQFRLVGDFNKDATHWNGVNKTCKECFRIKYGHRGNAARNERRKKLRSFRSTDQDTTLRTS